MANGRLAGRIVQVQEVERRKIERDLHDGAQQQLVALIAQLGLARTHAKTQSLDAELLTDLQTQVQVILREVRELAQGIHPAVLTDAGLVEAIEDRCSRLPISIRVTVSDQLRQRRFADDIEGAAYFFVVEALTNVLKHAQAEQVTVSLAQQHGELVLTVGIGGFGGLTGLKDRFVALAGSVSVTSAPGHGTAVCGRLPIDQGADT